MPMKIAVSILLMPIVLLGSSPIKQTVIPSSPPRSIDSYSGLGEARDAEQISFAKKLVAIAKREGGVVKISTWIWRGKSQWYAQRLISSSDGLNVWSGPNPPMGYHTSQRTYQIIDYSKIRP